MMEPTGWQDYARRFKEDLFLLVPRETHYRDKVDHAAGSREDGRMDICW